MSNSLNDYFKFIIYKFILKNPLKAFLCESSLSFSLPNQPIHELIVEFFLDIFQL